MKLIAKKALMTTYEAVVTRVDGTVENLGIISRGYRCLGCDRNFGAHWTFTIHPCWWNRLRSR